MKAELLAGRGGPTGSWPWTVRLLDAADRRAAGHWRVVTIDAARALSVWLPSHAGEPCQGDRLTLVTEPGATVADAAAAFARIEAAYAKDNRSCWSRITRAAGEPFSPIALCNEPADPAGAAKTRPPEGTLFHLDGFHRLVGWAWAGRLVPGAAVRAFVADTAGSRLS